MPKRKLNKDQLKRKNELRKASRLKNIEKTRENGRIYAKKLRIENPKWAMISNARKRAKDIGIEFNITQEDIIVPEYCPVLGFKLNKLGDIDYERYRTPSIDRVDNTKGYTKDNICIISERANRLKSDASPTELEAILKYIKVHTGDIKEYI